MGNIKVLPADLWMTLYYDDHPTMDRYVEVKPVFYRDGQYVEDNVWWFEVDGRAWMANTTEQNQIEVDNFKFRLRASAENILSQREVDALKKVIDTTRRGHLKKYARQQLAQHEDAANLRDASRRSTHMHYKFMIRALAFKRNKGL